MMTMMMMMMMIIINNGQAKKIDKDKTRKQTVREMDKRTRSLNDSELYDSLVKAVNASVIAVWLR